MTAAAGQPGPGSGPLAAAERPLVETYDTGLFDLDGVVYVGSRAVPGVPVLVKQARASGLRICFVTNNASRPPTAVVEHLDRVGVQASVDDVVTSAQAAAGLLAERIPPGSRVLVVGGEGLHAALHERGFVPVAKAADHPAAVVQGFHPDVGWRQLAEGAYALSADLPWVASNVDLTLPTDGGLAPGNGTLVEVLRLATGRSPVIAGKPAPPLFAEAVARCGGRRPLVVGDRLDTDIEGAHAAGLPSLLVLTGVTRLRDLALAPTHQRPTYVASDLGGLFSSHPSPAVVGDGARCNGWTARLDRATSGRTTVAVSGDGDALDGARAVLAAIWAAPDPAAVDATEVLDGLHRSSRDMS
jgi:glycerol-1-phosphatase